MARLVTVTSGKGGVGKTNISVSLAVQLANLGHRTCLFDADLGLANVNILLGLYPEHTLEDVILNGKTISDIVIQKYKGMDIIPGSSGIEKMAHLECDRLQPLFEKFSGLDNYDFIIFDTSAGVSENVTSFCRASSEVVLIITGEPTSLTDAYGLLKILSLNGFEGSVMVVVNESKDAKAANIAFTKFKNAVHKHLPIKIIPLGLVFHDDYVAEAVKVQEPFISRYPQSEASKCIRTIAKRLIKKEGVVDEEFTVERFWTDFVDFYKAPLRFPNKRNGDSLASSKPSNKKECEAEPSQDTGDTVAADPQKVEPTPFADVDKITRMVHDNNVLLGKLSETLSSLAKDMSLVTQIAGNKNSLNSHETISSENVDNNNAVAVDTATEKELRKKPNKLSSKSRLWDLIDRLPEEKCKKLIQEMQVLLSKDQRKHPRAACSIPVDYDTQKGSFEGFIKDISKGGVFIETRVKPKVGEKIKLTFSSPKQPKPIKIAGRVVRKNILGVGVSFEKMLEAVDESSWIDCRRNITETGKEKRVDPRVDLQCPVYIEGVPDPKTITDLSIGGVFIECDGASIRKLEKGKFVTLTMKLPTEDDVIKVKAKVVNQSNRGVHCQFAQLGREIEDAIYRCYNMAKHTIPIK